MKNSRERLAFQDLHHHCGLRSVSWSAHRSIQLQHVQFPALIGWVSVYWPADCQQVSSKGETCKGIQAQRTVTAAGRKAGYVRQPTDCIICCPLFVAYYPFFWNHPATTDGYVWPSGCTICCPLFTSLGAFKTGISFHIESYFHLLCVARSGSIWDIKLWIRNCSSGRDFLSGLSVCHSGREMVAICHEKGKKTIFGDFHIQLSKYASIMESRSGSK